MIFGFLITILVVVFDQISKHYVFGNGAKSIIGDILWFQSEKNTGAAFSLLSGKNWFFVLLVSFSAVIMVLLICSKKVLPFKLQKISLGIILGGAIGNLIDRIAFGFVRDFLYLKFINFAIFNIADFAITVGAILLAISILFSKEKEVKK